MLMHCTIGLLGWHGMIISKVASHTLDVVILKVNYVKIVDKKHVKVMCKLR